MIDKAITILGGFAGGDSELFPGGESLEKDRNPFGFPAVLSGDLNGDDGDDFANMEENLYHVLSVTNDGAVIDGLTISGGNADGSGGNANGGGISLVGISPIFKSCTFSGNRANAFGGGLYVSAASPKLLGCVFTGNHADSGGGAYLANLSDVEMTKVSFAENAADTLGGGLYTADSRVVHVSCLFAGNTAPNGAGAFHDKDSISPMSNCVFSANTADENGGGLLDNGTTDLFNCTFADNVAGGVGGGIGTTFLVPAADAQTQADLMAGDGAIAGTITLPMGQPSVVINAAGLTLARPDYPRNLVYYVGEGAVGSIVANGTDPRDQPVEETMSGLATGALATGSVVFKTIESITVNYNEDTGGSVGVGIGGAFFSELPTVTNSILWGNTDSTGAGESAQIDAVGAPINFSDVDGLSGDRGTGNISADPLFLDADGGDDTPGTSDDLHYLSNGSPCIDAGDGSLRSADLSDVDGDGDVLELVEFDFDLNPRILDDPTAADGGPAVAGAEGIVAALDIGAYERQEEDCNDNRLIDREEIELGLPDPCAADPDVPDLGGDDDPAPDDDPTPDDDPIDGTDDDPVDDTGGDTGDDTGGDDGGDVGGDVADDTGGDEGGDVLDIIDTVTGGGFCSFGSITILPILAFGMALMGVVERRRRRQ